MKIARSIFAVLIICTVCGCSNSAERVRDLWVTGATATPIEVVPRQGILQACADVVASSIEADTSVIDDALKAPETLQVGGEKYVLKSHRPGAAGYRTLDDRIHVNIVDGRPDGKDEIFVFVVYRK